MNNMIELSDVSYSYEGTPALKNITLRIEKGESVALMGMNGSGKSTLLKLINGILFPDSGTYRFAGEKITHKKMQDPLFSKRFHQKIGFVFQNADTQLFCADVYDEIAFGPRQMGLDEDETEKRVEDCLSLLSIEALRHRQPYHLSGGEKRKVAIASVLSLNPEVLVFDEPLLGLDPRTQRWFVSFLMKLHEAGKTLLVSTHNLEMVQEMAERAVLFDESHTIAADRPAGELLKDVDLLIRTNLVDEYYHHHPGAGHQHFHIHPF
ncbi:nickel import ATP-binding protein NikO [Caproiciproducens galactitolivorans]|uniref:Nickel import ATP-binding protein NikO n=2 Tax=Caproiciproducens galactitolivorans TaxID=642589 RepID=A0A4Z0YAL6_9FIRM|nr:nickel import ATP-binding protein NikO [Caproiciproducens galactitolivorans]